MHIFLVLNNYVSLSVLKFPYGSFNFSDASLQGIQLVQNDFMYNGHLQGQGVTVPMKLTCLLCV